ncbi:Ribose-phosphate pyrophosphokinase [Defluviimonas aquaemixtae]|uniref:ribose-phosphate diphosphokinase n=1 Tax=Albidovulum aquaemixtae TaxID=1542388 RepID=A0A2R8B878_9RHOB|nr:ribose-phosphate pyrophosphokinase [Defluviimonas aquaemixtae]SPH18806.1 Ribose-phosphate pyrophosphokinase [Defluviimonas aquaemixtae]
MLLFAMEASRDFGQAVAGHLGTNLDPHEERAFEDGEHKSRPLVNVRGRDAYVIQGLHGDAEQNTNDKLVRLLMFLATLKDDGAARVTAVIPYLAYARKDRQTKARDPVATRTLARLIESVGTDSVMTLDVHNLAAFQNAFRCCNWHLDTRSLFARHVIPQLGSAELSVVSPDAGGVKRAQLFREMLEGLLGRPVRAAFMEKRRSAGVVSGSHLVGDAEGRTAIVVDDMIASGGTMVRAAQALKERGAEQVIAFAAHGLFTKGAEQALEDAAIDRWIVTDTVPRRSIDPVLFDRRVEVVSAAPLFAEAIRRLHHDGSLVELLSFPG